MGKSDYDLNINVMMVGGRRCGKTSVLASMQKCFGQTQVNTPLVIRCANEEMLDIIGQKQQEMQQYFSMKGKNKVFVPRKKEKDNTDEVSEYPFSIGLKGKKSRIRINFVDYPGEWLKNRKDKVAKALKSSRILLVAIDTPHLMEEDGAYNEPHNRCWLVSEMVKGAAFAEMQEPGLVLFVPLKCERYYNEGRMDEVNARVQKAYENMLNYIRQPGADGKKSRITAAITPILTLGGAEFSRFERDENGDIRIDEDGTPEKAIYWFPDMGKSEPEPQYCEQPLLYVLSYVLTAAQKAKQAKKKGNMADIILEWIQRSLMNWPSADDYLSQREAVDRQVKKDGDGYGILNKGICQL